MSIVQTAKSILSRHSRRLVCLIAICFAPGLRASNLATPEPAIWSLQSPSSSLLFEHLRRGTLSDLLRLPLVDYQLPHEQHSDPLQPVIEALTPLVTEGNSALRNPFEGPVLLFGSPAENGGQDLALVLTVGDRLLIHRYLGLAIPRLQTEYPNSTKTRISGADVHLLTRVQNEEETFANPFAAESAWWDMSRIEPAGMLRRFDTLAVAIVDKHLIVATSLVAMRTAVNNSQPEPTFSTEVTPPAVVPAVANDQWLRVEVDFNALMANARRHENAAAAQSRLGLDQFERLIATVHPEAPADGIAARLEINIELRDPEQPKFIENAQPLRVDKLPASTLVYLSLNTPETITITRLWAWLKPLIPNASMPVAPPIEADIDSLLRPCMAGALAWGNGPELGLWLKQPSEDAAKPLAELLNATPADATVENPSMLKAELDGEWLSLSMNQPKADTSTLADNPRFQAALHAIGSSPALFWFDDQSKRLEFAAQLKHGDPSHDFLGSHGMSAENLQRAKSKIGDRGASALGLITTANGFRITTLITTANPPRELSSAKNLPKSLDPAAANSAAAPAP